jgi:hypothetical protein
MRQLEPLVLRLAQEALDLGIAKYAFGEISGVSLSDVVAWQSHGAETMIFAPDRRSRKEEGRRMCTSVAAVGRTKQQRPAGGPPAAAPRCAAYQ